MSNFGYRAVESIKLRFIGSNKAKQLWLLQLSYILFIPFKFGVHLGREFILKSN